MNFKSVIFGFVVFCGLGLVACGNNDGSSTAGVAETNSADVSKSDGSDENSQSESGLFAGENLVEGTIFDVSPPTSVLETSTTYSDNSVTQPETIPETAKPFSIRVGKKEQSPSTEKPVPTTAAPAPVDYILFKKPEDCRSVALNTSGLILDSGKLSGNAADSSPNDELYHDFVDRAFGSCLYRTRTRQVDMYVLHLRAVAIDIAAENISSNARAAALASEAKGLVGDLIYPSPEASCMRGGKKCSPVRSPNDDQGRPIKCLFDRVQVPHANAKSRLESICQNNLDIVIKS